MGEKIVLFTAIFGNYDLLRPVNFPLGRAICFTDNPDLKVDGWETEVIETAEFDARFAARSVKIRPDMYFEHDRSIWIDANLEYLGDWNDLNMSGFWAMKHNLRDCVFDEITACFNKGKEATKKLAFWRGVLDGYGFPKHFGLHATGVLIRDNSKTNREFCLKWWQNVEAVSHRDQLTFDFTRWRRNIEIGSIPFLHNFTKHKHLK